MTLFPVPMESKHRVNTVRLFLVNESLSKKGCTLVSCKRSGAILTEITRKERNFRASFVPTWPILILIKYSTTISFLVSSRIQYAVVNDRLEERVHFESKGYLSREWRNLRKEYEI